MKEWRPPDWIRHLPRQGSRFGGYKVEDLREAVLRRFAYEAGADAMLRALQVTGMKLRALQVTGMKDESTKT